MAHLKVKSQGKLIYETELLDNKVYTVGRKEDCEICLADEKGISREHLRLVKVNNSWQVEVLSRFGNVFYKGEALPSFTLEPGTIFTVLNFEFEYSEASLSSSNLPELRNPNTADESSFDENLEKTVIGRSTVVPTIKILDSNKELISAVPLQEGSKWIAGRESTSDIHISDPRVSRRQFEIKKEAGNYYIIDLGSINGTLVNDLVISKTEYQPLYSGDIIKVLEYELNFEIIDLDYSKKISNLPVASKVEAHADNALATGDSSTNNAVNNLPTNYHSQTQMMTPYMPHPNQGMVPYQGHTPSASNSYQAFLYDLKNNKDKKRKAILVILAVVILGGAYFYKVQSDNATVAVNKLKSDPFNNLTPEKQEAVKGFYSKAKYYLQQEKWELARSEIMKLKEVINSYLDSEELLKFVEVQYQTLREREEITKREEEAKMIDEKIQAITEKCQKLINPNITMEEMDHCLSDAKALNPEHNLISSLINQVQGIITERELKSQEKKEYLAKVAQLRSMYNRAVATEKADQLVAIDLFNKVIESSLPDPNGLKKNSNIKIQEIKNNINSKTQKLQKDADEFANNLNYKEAILALREAKKVDPKNFMIDEKINKYIHDLKKQMKVLYEEGVLEENFGNVEGGENKPGAKDKWKKILEKDINDGEYYKKAYIRLKKYGAL